MECLIPAKVITARVRDHLSLSTYVIPPGSIFGRGTDFNPVAVANTRDRDQHQFQAGIEPVFIIFAGTRYSTRGTVGPPDRKKHDILGMILGIFWPVQAVIEVR